MHFPRRYFTLYFSVIFVALVIWSGILFLTRFKTSEWNYLFNAAYAILYGLGGLIALVGARAVGLRTAVGKELLSFGIGMFGFALGLLAWAYYNLVLKVSIPYPSLADIFFVLYIPFFTYGITNLLHELDVFLTKRILFESSIIFILSVVFIIVLGNPPDVSPTLPLLAKIFNITYLIGDALLITLGVMLLRVTHGKIHGSFLFIVLALFAMASADLLFSYRTGGDIYWNGDIADVLYAFSGFLFAVGLTHIVAAQINTTQQMRAR